MCYYCDGQKVFKKNYSKEGLTLKTLKARILSIVLLCSIAAVMVCGGISIRDAIQTTSDNSQVIISNATEEAAGNMNQTLELIAQSVDTFASICIEEIDDFQAFQTDADYVENYTNALLPVARKFGQNTSGALTCYVRYNPEFTEPDSGIFLSRPDMDSDFEMLTPTDFSIYDPTDLEHVGWYYIPVNNGKPTWMDPYLNANINTYMISYVVPIYIDDVSVGIVGMDIDFTLLQELIDEVSVYNTGYAFLTSSENTVLYHNDLENGTDLKSATDAGQKAVNKILDGEEGKIQAYTYKKQNKFLAYKNLINGMKMAVSVPEKQIKKDTYSMVWHIVIAEIISFILVAIVGLVFSFRIAKPLKAITEIVEKTANLKLERDRKMDSLCKNKDETGGIARAVDQMQEKLRAIVGDIQSSSQQIEESAKKLTDLTLSVHDVCNDNSATTQELAASMEETAATTETIYQNVVHVNENAEEIAGLSKSGVEVADEVKERATGMTAITQEATRKTREMCDTMISKTHEALEQVKAVEKINEMTAAITDISSQTNLLALNASIEAARAGEAGKGFAVVATEIGNLANQTLDTVNHITEIVKEVNLAVGHMAKCLEESTQFLQDTVLDDYSEFQKVSGQYTEDARIFEDSMTHIKEAVTSLSSTMKGITEALSGINTTVNEAAGGVSDIAEKSVVLEGEISDARMAVEEDQKSVERLNDVISRFRL